MNHLYKFSVLHLDALIISIYWGGGGGGVFIF